MKPYTNGFLALFSQWDRLDMSNVVYIFKYLKCGDKCNIGLKLYDSCTYIKLSNRSGRYDTRRSDAKCKKC